MSSCYKKVRSVLLDLTSPMRPGYFKRSPPLLKCHEKYFEMAVFHINITHNHPTPVFCQPVPVCSTCKTKFPIKTLQRLNALRPPTASLSGGGTVSNAPSPAPSTPSLSRAPSLTQIAQQGGQKGHGANGKSPAGRMNGK